MKKLESSHYTVVILNDPLAHFTVTICLFVRCQAIKTQTFISDPTSRTRFSAGSISWRARGSLYVFYSLS